jgi:hypothetical protein
LATTLQIHVNHHRRPAFENIFFLRTDPDSTKLNRLLRNNVHLDDIAPLELGPSSLSVDFSPTLTRSMTPHLCAPLATFAPLRFKTLLFPSSGAMAPTRVGTHSQPEAWSFGTTNLRQVSASVGIEQSEG